MNDIRNYLEEGMVYNTVFICQNCEKTMTVKYKDNWFALQCRCKHSLYYNSGHFTVIPKKVWLINKERGDKIVSEGNS